MDLLISEGDGQGQDQETNRGHLAQHFLAAITGRLTLQLQPTPFLYSNLGGHHSHGARKEGAQEDAEYPPPPGGGGGRGSSRVREFQTNIC